MGIYTLVRLYEEGKLYDTELDNLDSDLIETEKILKNEEEEIEFYAETDQRTDNLNTLRNIVSILEYRKKKTNDKENKL